MSSVFASIAVTHRPPQSLLGPENQNLAINRAAITIERINRTMTNAFFTASLSSHPPGRLLLTPPLYALGLVSELRTYSQGVSETSDATNMTIR